MSTIKPVTQTVDNIRNMASAFAETASALEGLAAIAGVHGFDRIDVTNFDQARRAMEYAANYAAAVRTAINRARAERGDFAAESVSPARAKPAKKPAKKTPRSGHGTHTKDT